MVPFGRMKSIGTIVLALATCTAASSSADAQKPQGLAELLLGEGAKAEKSAAPVESPVQDPPSDDTTAESPSPIALESVEIRVLRSRHLELHTDIPSAIAIDQLPRLFDLAVKDWAKYLEAPDADTTKFKVTACLIRDREKFRRKGLLPDDLPKFREGYQRGDQIWLYDQATDYYRRHLLFHEGVHAFSRMVKGGAGPPWYREGVAEYLATHLWSGAKLSSAVVPASPEDVPGWGRIHTLRREYAEGRGLMLQEIMQYPEEAFLQDVPYAWCWAAVAFLDRHPTYGPTFRKLVNHVEDESVLFTRLLQRTWMNEMRGLDEEWQVFVLNAEYGYDFAANAIEFADGVPLPKTGADCLIQAARGWQSTGIRLEKGKNYLLKAQGEVQIAHDGKPWQSEANGVTLRYYGGFPLGQLVGNIRGDQAPDGVSQLATPIPVGTSRVLAPVTSGTLYLKINDAPNELADNQGALNVHVAPAEPAATQP